MKKQVNYDALTECIIAILGGSIFILKVVDGSFLDYVSPKFKILLVIAGILFLAIGISRIPSIWKNSYISHYKRYLLLAIPMLMLMIPHNSITASSLKNSYSSAQIQVNKNDGNSTNDMNSDENRNQEQSEIEDNSITDNSNTDSSETEEQSNVANSGSNDSSLDSENEPADVNPQLSGLDIQAKKITVSDEEFYQWISEFYENYDQYEGYEVSIKGMKYQDDSISGDEFAIVRLAMVCCAADLVPCGPLCQYDKTDELQDDTWYTVTGTLGNETVDGQMEIKFNINRVEESSAPDEPYIYPYY